jgi:tetratricopeptide (TPR) repeat protein
VDLAAHRNAVRETLARMDIFAAAMEIFGAWGTGDAKSVSLAELAKCDAYIGIVAWRYGYVPSKETQSVTHMEYLEAGRLGMPRFMFLADPSTETRDGPHDLFPAASRDPENRHRLLAFREEVVKVAKQVVDPEGFTSPDHLARLVATALHKWIVSVRPQAPAQAPSDSVILTPADFSEAQGGLRQPPDITGLIGREKELAWLKEHVVAAANAGIYGISGMGGLGKTALVAWCLGQMKQDLTGGCAVVHADNVVDPDEILKTLVRKFVRLGDQLISQLKPETIRKTLSDLLAGVLQRIRDQGKRAVVVIDNVERQLVERQLAHGDLKSILNLIRDSGTSVIITSREKLPLAYINDPLELWPLGDAEVIELFTRRSGRFATRPPSPEESHVIAQVCGVFGGHTLATIVAASTLETNASLSLATFRDQLAQPARVLDGIAPEAPEGVRRVFASSYAQLQEPAQQLFAALGAIEDRGTLVEAVVGLGKALGQPDTEARRHLDSLIRSSLVNVVLPARERISLHPLIQEFVRGLLHEPRFPVEVDRLHAALAEYYAAWAEGKRTDQLGAEIVNLTAALKWAAQHTSTSRAALAGLAHGLRWYWHDRHQYEEGLKWLPLGFDALKPTWFSRSQQADSLERRSRLAFAVGRHYLLTGKVDAAEEWFRTCNRLAGRTGNRTLIANAVSGLAAIAQYWGRSDRAKELYEQSLRLYSDIKGGDRRNEADALYRLGFLALRVGETMRAQEYYERSLILVGDDERDRGVRLHSLGNVDHQLGNIEEARAKYLQGLKSCENEANPNRRGEGVIKKALGDLAWQITGPAAAVPYLQESLEVFRSIFDLQSQSVALYSYAFVHRQMGRLDEARTYYDQSLKIREQVHDRRGEAFVRKGIGDLLRRTAGGRATDPAGLRTEVAKDMREAKRFIEGGLQVSREVKDRRNTGVALKALGDLEFQRRRWRAAHDYYQRSLKIRETIREKAGRAITSKALADLSLVQGDVAGARERLVACQREFEELGDLRGQGAVWHSLGVLQAIAGDTPDPATYAQARTCFETSRGLLQQVQDQQSLAVVLYGLACIAEALGDLEQPRLLSAEAAAAASASQGVLIRAVLDEGRAAFLIAYGAAPQRAEAESLLGAAAERYLGLMRRADAARAKGRTGGSNPDRPRDRILDALIFDLDEGPNGQGFTIPNDRRPAQE